MKMNRTNTTSRLLALLLIALNGALSDGLRHKGRRQMDGMSSEPKNAEEAAAMHKELMAQEMPFSRRHSALGKVSWRPTRA